MKYLIIVAGFVAGLMLVAGNANAKGITVCKNVLCCPVEYRIEKLDTGKYICVKHNSDGSVSVSKLVTVTPSNPGKPDGGKPGGGKPGNGGGTPGGGDDNNGGNHCGGNCGVGNGNGGGNGTGNEGGGKGPSGGESHSGHPTNGNGNSGGDSNSGNHGHNK